MIDPRLLAIAKRIETAIQTAGITAADVAREMGISPSTVSRWISGERQPTMQHLHELADLLGVEAIELWAGPVAIPSTPEQALMMAKMARMTPEQQQAFIAMAASITGAS